MPKLLRILLYVKSLKKNSLSFIFNFNFSADQISDKDDIRITGIEENAAKCCLSRLYFALNRIQGALQIDKKKRETSVLECSKGPKNDMRTQKKLTERKHGDSRKKKQDLNVRSVAINARSRESLLSPLRILLISFTTHAIERVSTRVRDRPSVHLRVLLKQTTLLT